MTSLDCRSNLRNRTHRHSSVFTISSCALTGLLACLPVFLSPNAAQAQERSWIWNHVMAKGGCDSYRDAFWPVVVNNGNVKALLGRNASQWRPEDGTEALRVISACEADIAQRSRTASSSVERLKLTTLAKSSTDAQERIKAGLASFIENGQAQQARSIAKAEAEIESAKDAAGSKIEAMALEAQQAQEKLAALERIDREAANRAATVAGQEEPKIREAARKAEEARQERLAAEQKLADIRSRLSDLERERESALSEARSAEASRQAMVKQQALAAIDSKLTTSCAVTRDQYERLRFGMSVEQVNRVFGCKGSEVSSMRPAGVGTWLTMEWQGSKEFSEVVAVFRNGKMETKRQTGLE